MFKKKLCYKKNNCLGFTLTEMIVVIAVTSIFFAIVMTIGFLITKNQIKINKEQKINSEMNLIIANFEVFIQSNNQNNYQITIKENSDKGFLIECIENEQIKQSLEFITNTNTLILSFDGVNKQTKILKYINVLECYMLDNDIGKLLEIYIQANNNETINRVYRIF